MIYGSIIQLIVIIYNIVKKKLE